MRAYKIYPQECALDTHFLSCQLISSLLPIIISWSSLQCSLNHMKPAPPYQVASFSYHTHYPSIYCLFHLSKESFLISVPLNWPLGSVWIVLSEEGTQTPILPFPSFHLHLLPPPLFFSVHQYHLWPFLVSFPHHFWQMSSSFFKVYLIT